MLHYTFTAVSDGERIFENLSTSGEVMGNWVPVWFLWNTVCEHRAAHRLTGFPPIGKLDRRWSDDKSNSPDLHVWVSQLLHFDDVAWCQREWENNVLRWGRREDIIERSVHMVSRGLLVNEPLSAGHYLVPVWPPAMRPLLRVKNSREQGAQRRQEIHHSRVGALQQQRRVDAHR